MDEIRTCKKHGKTLHRQDSNGTFRCLRCRSEHVTLRRQRIKLQAIAFLGGKCSICGYNKCPDALEFHHLDPNEKDFGVSYDGRCRAWDTVKSELLKCELVCANCHRELHFNTDKHNITVVPARVKKIHRCVDCGVKLTTNSADRCVKCAKVHNRKVVRPSKEVLITDLHKFSFVQVGKKYGVTDNTIRKWLKAYGVDPKTIHEG